LHVRYYNGRNARNATYSVVRCVTLETGLYVHTQKHVDCFANAAELFGLTISLKKTEVMLQPHQGYAQPKSDILVGDTLLKLI